MCFLFVNKTLGITMQSGQSTLELNWIKHSTWDFYLISYTQQGQDTRTFKRLSLHTCLNCPVSFPILEQQLLDKVKMQPLLCSWYLCSNQHEEAGCNKLDIFQEYIISLSVGLGFFFCQLFLGGGFWLVCFVFYEVLYLLRNFNHVTKSQHLWK